MLRCFEWLFTYSPSFVEHIIIWILGCMEHLKTETPNIQNKDKSFSSWLATPAPWTPDGLHMNEMSDRGSAGLL